MNIILYLLGIIQQLYQQSCWLINFICKYIPLKQWAFEDSHSPKYQKFKVDKLPRIVFRKQDWDWQALNSYYIWKYGKPVNPVKRRSACDIPEQCTCPTAAARRARCRFSNSSNSKIGSSSRQLILLVVQIKNHHGEDIYDPEILRKRNPQKRLLLSVMKEKQLAVRGLL